MPTGESALVPHPFLVKSLEPLVGLFVECFNNYQFMSIAHYQCVMIIKIEFATEDCYHH